MECSVDFAGIGESSSSVVRLNPTATNAGSNASLGASVTTLKPFGRGLRGYGAHRQKEIGKRMCPVADLLPGATSGRSVQESIARHFNDLIRRHCDRVPSGLGSISQGGDNSLWEGDTKKGAGGSKEESVEDRETQPSGQDEKKRKTVLILMSDTGGGHRASAEAIKATFELEYGDQYKVLTFSILERLWRCNVQFYFSPTCGEAFTVIFGRFRSIVVAVDEILGNGLGFLKG